MMMAMLVAGIACLLAGLLAIGFGIPVNEFSFGNTLILAGAMAACAGLIILSMWAAVRELKNMAARIGPDPALDRHGAKTAVAAALLGPVTAEHNGSKTDDRMPGGLADIAEASADPSAASTVPWQEDAEARDRQEPPPAPKPRRNLMFSSSSRRERERAQARGADASASEPRSTMLGASPAHENTPPPPLHDAWPRSERSRTADPLLQRRAGRPPSTSGEARQPPAARQAPVAAPAEDPPAVTV